jgi:hypothetical protein
MTSFGPDDVVLHLILPPYTLDDPRLVLGEIYCGIAYEGWRVGPMTKQWYGWNWSCEFGAGIQANHIDGPLYRFDPEQHVSMMYRKPKPVWLDCAHCGEPTGPGRCRNCGVLNE